MKISEILALPKGVEKVSDVVACIGYVNELKELSGIAKTGKNKGKPYKFFAQNIEIVDGDSKIYWNATFQAEMDSIKKEDTGKEIKILETSINYYTGKDGAEHKCLKGGYVDRTGFETPRVIPKEVTENYLKAKEEENKASIQTAMPLTTIDVKPTTDWDKKNRTELRARAYTTCLITMYPILIEKLKKPDGELPDNKDIEVELDYFAEQIYNFAIKEPLKVDETVNIPF